MTTAAADRSRGDLLVAFAACRRLAALVASGRHRFEADADRRAHLRYLWIVAGSRLARPPALRRTPGERATYAAVVRLRDKLSHTAPDRIDDRLLWRATERCAMALARDLATALERVPDGG